MDCLCGQRLSNGESYYYSCAMTAARSHFDQMPMANWLVFLSVKALGVNALAVRLPVIVRFDLAAVCHHAAGLLTAVKRRKSSSP